MTTLKMSNDIVAAFALEAPNAIRFPDPAPKVLEPGVTVVVCTRHRPDCLLRFLDSLRIQKPLPTGLLLIDGSDGSETENALRSYLETADFRVSGFYCRVAKSAVGLTRQRNLSLRYTATDLIAFFDDDIVLLPECLRRMAEAHRQRSEDAVGVGANLSSHEAPSLLWRIRLRLRIVGSLQPGSYQRSGMSVPWGFVTGEREVWEGDWLPGGATMWKTDVVRKLGFASGFRGYGQSEDLEFSLRARAHGKLLYCPSARLLHLHESSARPRPFDLGYMAIANRYFIHRTCLTERTWRDTAWFIYAWALDSLMHLRHLLSPGHRASTILHLFGRAKGAWDVLPRFPRLRDALQKDSETRLGTEPTESSPRS